MPTDLHFALFVRDAAGLGGGRAGVWPAPGPLDRRVAAPDLCALAGASEHQRAREQWPRWWDALVAGLPLDLEEIRERVRRAPTAGDPRIGRATELADGSVELGAIIARCAPAAAEWERQRKPVVPEFMRRYNALLHEVGIELQQRTDMAGEPPVDATIDFLMTDGDGAAIASSVRAIAWGNALADPEIREALLTALA
jgi:hypothetical protein